MPAHLSHRIAMLSHAQECCLLVTLLSCRFRCSRGHKGDVTIGGESQSRKTLLPVVVYCKMYFKNQKRHVDYVYCSTV
jgi:hypothetical protein